MNTTPSRPEPETYSVRPSLRAVHFFYAAAPDATSVQVTGDFNHWHPVPMQRRVDGCWFAEILIHHGHHQYRFLVDGRPVLDPRAAGTDRDATGEPVSIVAVG
jgi:1,4-alpha-glucan branching enzyme